MAVVYGSTMRSAAPVPVRAVLLDMTMPHMDGVETFRALRAHGCQAPIVLTSGYSEQEALDRFKEMGIAGFVQKPFAVGPLLRAMRGSAAAPANPVS